MHYYEYPWHPSPIFYPVNNGVRRGQSMRKAKQVLGNRLNNLYKKTIVSIFNSGRLNLTKLITMFLVIYGNIWFYISISLIKSNK